MALYDAYEAGRPSPLPELPVQYADYALWRRQRENSDAFRDDLDYWQKTLAGAQPLALPTDHERPEEPSFRGGRHIQLLSEELTSTIGAFCESEDVTRFMVLLAAYYVLLHRHSDQTDLTVGVANARRTRMQLEPLIGFFVNMQAFRIQYDPASTFRDLVRRTRNTVIEGFNHHDIPFNVLVNEIADARSLHQHPLFQVAFGTVEGLPSEEVANSIDSLDVEAIDKDSAAARYDLTLWVDESNDKLREIWKYSKDLFEHDTIRQMAKHFDVLVQQCFTNPDVRLETLDMQTPEEKKRRKSREHQRQQKIKQELSNLGQRRDDR